MPCSPIAYPALPDPTDPNPAAPLPGLPAPGQPAQSPPPADTATFPVRIDATRLWYRAFIIPGVTPGFVDARRVQDLRLAAGRYSFQFASGYYADFTFRVTADGTIAYEPAYATFLSGAGSATLTLDGLPVTLDARRLSGSGVLFANVPGTRADWIAHRQIRLLPASHYSVQQGSGQVSGFTFKLGVDGRFDYDPALDDSSGGFLHGRGTPVLRFVGYPVCIDARQAGSRGVVLLESIWGMPTATDGLQYARLLPLSRLTLRFGQPGTTWPRFSLNRDGTLTVPTELAGYLRLDPTSGAPTLRVVAVP